MDPDLNAPADAPPPPGAAPTDHLTLFLAERDAPCPACGYNLRQLRSPLCPECGERLELRVGMVEPRLGLWITGLMATGAGAGFNALLLGYVLILLTWRRGLGGFAGFLAINGIGLLVEGTLVALWLTQRHRFRRMDRPARVALVVAAVLISLLDLAVFSAFVR